jgi:hypothetical protein
MDDTLVFAFGVTGFYLFSWSYPQGMTILWHLTYIFTGATVVRGSGMHFGVRK